MSELKSKLHELIDSTNDTVFLENIYRAMKHQVGMDKRDILDDISGEQLSQLNESIAQYRRKNNSKDFLDELSPDQLKSLHEANAQFERGETIPYDKVLEKYKRWERK